MCRCGVVQRRAWTQRLLIIKVFARCLVSSKRCVEEWSRGSITTMDSYGFSILALMGNSFFISLLTSSPPLCTLVALLFCCKSLYISLVNSDLTISECFRWNLLVWAIATLLTNVAKAYTKTSSTPQHVAPPQRLWITDIDIYLHK